MLREKILEPLLKKKKKERTVSQRFAGWHHFVFNECRVLAPRCCLNSMINGRCGPCNGGEDVEHGQFKSCIGFEFGLRFSAAEHFPFPVRVRIDEEDPCSINDLLNTSCDQSYDF